MIKKYSAALLILTLLFPIFIITKSSAADFNLELTGSSTIAPLISEIAKRFEMENPDFRVNVQTGGSSRGIADARRGLVDIGMSSRPLYDEEKKDVSVHTLAMDGISFVVHKDNPLKNLSKEQVRSLYTGKIKNWKELGGLDSKITIIDRAKSRSEHDLLNKYLGLKSKDIVASITCGENQQCMKLVTGNKNAIALISIGLAEFEASKGTPINLVALDGVEASSETVKEGKFPIVRPLILISSKEPAAKESKFLNYSLSTQVNDLIKEQSFVPVN